MARIQWHPADWDAVAYMLPLYVASTLQILEVTCSDSDDASAGVEVCPIRLPECVIMRLTKSGSTSTFLCRYLSHFRSVHRGAYFAELRTTTVRKLMPEAWGFLCPVHTPDGSPCGLLNHLSAMCRVVTRRADEETLSAIHAVSQATFAQHLTKTVLGTL